LAQTKFPTPPDLTTQLSQADDTLTRANLYAQADLWYNTLEIVLAAPDQPSLRELKMSLLEQIATTAETAVREQAIVELTNSAIH
jgi:hypothetical protein